MPKKTRKDYPADWELIAEGIKNRDGWKCQNCGLQFSPEKRKVLDPRGKYQVITVHHRDRNVKNNDPSNLVSLCGRCHCQEEWPLIRAELSRKRNPGQLVFDF